MCQPVISYSLPAADLSALRAFPESVQRDIRRTLDALRTLASRGGATKKNLAAAALPARGFSASSLRRKWDLYHGSGGDWRVLVDHARTGGRRTMPEEFAKWFLDLLGSNQRRHVLRTAWRRFMLQFSAGEFIPGLGTWRDWWKATGQPGAAPAACPWDTLNPPPGLSLESCYRIRKSTAELAAQRQGIAAAMKHLAGVPRDFSELRFLEMVMFDDFETDFLVVDWDSGQVRPLLGLAALDVATRKVLAFTVWPKLERTDGTSVGVARRHMLHLIARLLREFGYPSYPCHWIVENAAATIQAEVRETLGLISGGCIHVHYSQIIKGSAILGGWTDRGAGNPNAKGPLENLWGFTWQELGWEPGQKGLNYTAKPASLEAREREAEKLIAAGAALPVELRNELVSGYFHSVQDAVGIINAVWQRAANRRDHRLQGFDFVREWRWKNPGAPWVSFDAQPLPVLPAEALAAAVELRKRPESPNERAARLLLRDGAEFIRPGMEAIELLFCDKAILTYDGSGAFYLDRKGTVEKRLWFSAEGLDAVEGRRYFALHDADTMDGLAILDEQGRRLGWAPRMRGVDPRDVAGVREAIAGKQRRLRDTLANVAKRQPIEQLAATSARLDRQLEILTDAAGVRTTDAPRLAGVAEAVAETRQRSAAAVRAEAKADRQNLSAFLAAKAKRRETETAPDWAEY